MKIEIRRSGPKFQVVTVSSGHEAIMEDHLDTCEAARNKAMSIQRFVGGQVINCVADTAPATAYEQSGKRLPVSARV